MKLKAIVFCAATAAITAFPALASTFAVSSSGGTFTITRSGDTTYPLDASGETVIPETGKPARFFRLKATY